MPTLKQKRMKLQQKQKSWKKRQNLRKIFPGERDVLEKSVRSMQSRYWTALDNRTLEDVEKVHGIHFLNRVRDLRKRFKNHTLEVLDEAAGNSPFATQLAEKANQEFGPNAVNVTRTDCRTVGVPTLELVFTPAEKLVETFGKSRFHLVVSTWGGPSYTRIRPVIAMANIIEVLKPGGEARIFFNQQYPEPKAELEKRFPNIRIVLDENDKRRWVIFKQ